MQLGFDFATAPPPDAVSEPDRRQGDGPLFVRHRRARRYIVRVLDDGTVRVTLPRWGSKREARAFVERCSDWITRQLQKQRTRIPMAMPDEARLKERAAAELPGELMALAARYGIEVTRVSIRNQRTRWGACSSTGTITLNWRLILTPDFVREYVMIHELMHRREMNHSKRFWRHVASACPRSDEARVWLRKEGRQLFTGREMC
jgi:predicted metal-dependent hydrolase